MCILPFLVIAPLACSTAKQTTGNHEQQFNSPIGNFSMTIPNNWTMLKVQGIDSYMGRIGLGSRDTLAFSLGYFSYDLTEREPEDFKGNNPIKFEKSTVSWGNINTHRAKILKPKKYGKGMTGIYIDSLWTNQDGKLKFNLYGNKLSKSNQELFFETIKSTRFSQNQ